MKKKLLLVLSIVVIMGSIIAIATKPVHNLIKYDENTTLALFDENGDKIYAEMLGQLIRQYNLQLIDHAVLYS